MRFIQLRSAPAQNAGPLPARITTRMDLSFSTSENASFRREMSASSNALRTSGRLSVRRATPSFLSTSSITFCLCALHPKYAELRFFDRGVERGRDRQAQQAARVGRVDDAVVPQPRAGVVGVALGLVLLADRFLELLLRFLGREIALHR